MYPRSMYSKLEIIFVVCEPQPNRMEFVFILRHSFVKSVVVLNILSFQFTVRVKRVGIEQRTFPMKPALVRKCHCNILTSFFRAIKFDFNLNWWEFVGVGVCAIRFMLNAFQLRIFHISFQLIISYIRFHFRNQLYPSSRIFTKISRIFYKQRLRLVQCLF